MRSPASRLAVLLLNGLLARSLGLGSSKGRAT